MKELIRLTLPEYIRLLGKWIWLLIADLLGIVQEILFEIPLLNKLPNGFWVGALFAFFLLANIHAFHKLRFQRDKLSEALDDREEISLSLSRLARLRTEGVALRNQAMRLEGQKVISQWFGEYREWHDRVMDQISKLSPAQAEVFQTLDWVRIRQLPDDLPAELQHYINLLSDEIENLKKLIEKCEPLFRVHE